jgi:uroporphyrinogen III methyltransferase/synthase
MTCLPLEGKRVLVTRAVEQAASLSQKLRALGAEPIEFPMIKLAPPADLSPLDRAIQRLTASQYDWVIFTSVNGVCFFCQRLRALGYEEHCWSTGKLAAIGPATAAALTKQGLKVDYMPARYLAEEIAAGIGDVRGQRILLPRADIARKPLTQELLARGALVDEVAAYRTVLANSKVAQLKELLKARRIDFITFTSASTVRNFAHLLEGSDLAQALSTTKIACIGPVTAEAAREQGIDVHIMAEEHTMNGLVEAIVEETSHV